MQKLTIITFGNIYNLDISNQTNKEVQAKSSHHHYKGGVKNGKANGNGTLLYDGKKYLEGTWKDGYIVKGEFYDLVNNNGKLAYDGKFKKGLFDGNGTMFIEKYNERYKGEFKNGKKNGQGKIFDEDDVLYIEGKWKNDELVSGKELDYRNGEVIYEGKMSYKNGRPIYNGKGTLKEDDDEYFTGTLKNGVKEGKGKIHRKDGSVKFEGTFQGNQKNGPGKSYYSNGNLAVEGKYLRGRLTGIVKTYYDSPDKRLEYVTKYERGFRRGKGKKYFYNGKVQLDGIFHGGFKRGRKYFSTGNGYEDGVYDLGERNGYCKIYYDDKLWDKGNWKRGYREGLHSIYHPNGELEFRGYYERGEKKGKGKEYWDNGKLKYDGMWRTSSYYGNGKKYHETGKLAEKGTFLYGRLENGSKYNEDGSYDVGHYDYKGKEGKCTEYWPNNNKKSVGVWKENKKHGIFSLYHENGKIQFRGRFEDDRKNGEGTEFDQNEKKIRKGYWRDGNYVGNAPTNSKQIQKGKLVEENNIKKFMQTNDKNFLKKVSSDSIKNYLKKYARKQIKTKSKASVLKELQKWRKQLKEPVVEQHTEPMVFDAYEGGDIPFREFLEEENRVVLISETGHAFGTYLEQCEIVYECQSRRSFYEYIGSSDVHAMIQFPSASGPKFYFDTDIVKDMDAGFNVFHFKTEPKDIKVLSKDVAAGGSIMSGLHCDPKDVIKRSVVTKKEKRGGGLKKTETFNW